MGQELSSLTLELPGSRIKTVTYEPKTCTVSDLVDALIWLYQVPAREQVVSYDDIHKATPVVLRLSEPKAMQERLGHFTGNELILNKFASDLNVGKEMRQLRPTDLKKRLDLYNEAYVKLTKRMLTSQPLIDTGPAEGFPIKAHRKLRYGRLAHLNGYGSEVLIPALIGIGVIPRLRCTHERPSPGTSCIPCYEHFIVDWYVLSREVLRHAWNGHRGDFETEIDEVATETMTTLDSQWWAGYKSESDFGGAQLEGVVGEFFAELGPHPELAANNVADECASDLMSFGKLVQMMTDDKWWTWIRAHDSILVQKGKDESSVGQEGDETVESILAGVTQFGKLTFGDFP